MTVKAINDIHPTAAALPPTTTAEEQNKAAGQRRVNIIWETTQAAIALAVVGVALYVNGVTAIYGNHATEIQSSALMQLNVLAALVTGFYFGRTNHQRTGGVGGDNAGTR